MLPAPNAQRSQLRKIEALKAAANDAVWAELAAFGNPNADWEKLTNAAKTANEAYNAAIEATWPAAHSLFFNLWVARTAFCRAARKLHKATKANEARAFSDYRQARRAYKYAHEMIFGW